MNWIYAPVEVPMKLHSKNQTWTNAMIHCPCQFEAVSYAFNNVFECSYIWSFYSNQHYIGNISEKGFTNWCLDRDALSKSQSRLNALSQSENRPSASVWKFIWAKMLAKVFKDAVLSGVVFSLIFIINWNFQMLPLFFKDLGWPKGSPMIHFKNGIRVIRI